jgi:hypothetical protein
VCVLTLAAGACSSGNAGLPTSALFSGSTKPKQVDVLAERAKLAAKTSASAVKCGYNVNPEKLRASYVSFETSLGTPEPEVSRAQQIYDTTRQSYGANLAKIPDFCSDDETARIKRTLTKHLAGNFDLPERKPDVDIGLFGNSDNKPMNRDEIFSGDHRKL